MKKSIFLFLIFPMAAHAAEGSASAGISSTALLVLISMLLIVLFFQSLLIGRLIDLVIELQRRLRQGDHAAPVAKAEVEPAGVESNWWQRIYQRLTQPVPAGKQKDVMLEHSYDGIRELDNHAPPWLQAIFYGTILFSVAYLMYYHVFRIGPTSAQEYQAEMNRAQRLKEARLSEMGGEITEQNVMLLTDAQALQAGKEIFTTRCASCHGMRGEGTTVAPNLTDEYWLHGGSIADVFRTIKYGVPAKGMIAWQGMLKPKEMQQTASYVLSLQGSNPPNAQPPQGERYVPPATDTTVAAVASAP
ncbi:MAG: cbb3-type cytochrome c oxidase N-terminal domain-containing protein [Chitinophagales bacterium]|nr:c-type cytochrome [Chitinophagales bacterium]MDW8394443.1 cbb3-type cytochrome c oxidase N-terminal domain-containing protein [Chitinophagales bacterium]